MDIKKMTYSQALAQMKHNEAMLEIYQIERKNIDEIVNQAINFPPGANRWAAYSALKKQGDLLVGWNAFSEGIKTSKHYKVLLDFIDYLVPQPADDTDEEPEIEEFPDEYEEEERTNNVTLYTDRWFQHADEVLEKLKTQHALQRSPRTENQALLDKVFSAFSKSDDETEN